MAAVNYDWDELEDNIDEEYDDAGTTIAEYTTEPYLYGDLVSQRRSGQSRFYHYDGLGSTLALTDSAAAVTDTNAYSAFGEVTEHSGSTTNPFQYVGQKGYYKDADTGECAVRRRPLSTRNGTWLSEDPFSSAAKSTDTAGFSHNLHVYAYNRPTVIYDPSGEAGLIVTNPQNTPIGCAACSAFAIKWEYDVPKQTRARTLKVVQKIYLQRFVTYCRPTGKRDCSGTEICEDWKKLSGICKSVYEYLGRIIVDKPDKEAFTTVPAHDDMCSLQLEGSGVGCELRGDTRIVSYVRAFDDSTFPNPEDDTTTGWKSGERQCGDFKQILGYYLTSEPDWWKDFSFEAHVRVERLFDCCNVPPESRLIARAWSGSDKKEAVFHVEKHCLDNKKLPEWATTEGGCGKK